MIVDDDHYELWEKMHREVIFFLLMMTKDYFDLKQYWKYLWTGDFPQIQLPSIGIFPYYTEQAKDNKFYHLLDI